MDNLHSQYGEDQWIVDHLLLPQKGVFVEIGGSDGVANSNTLFFERKGWTGLVVEPNPASYKDLRNNRRCATELCAIGSDPKRRFFLCDDPSLSGFDRTGVEIAVAIKRLDTVLTEHAIAKIDLLSLDTEGTELDVWRTFDHKKWRPQVVIIEWDTIGLPSKELAIMEFFYRLPYRMVHRTGGNLIFERLPVRMPDVLLQPSRWRLR